MTEKKKILQEGAHYVNLLRQTTKALIEASFKLGEELDFMSPYEVIAAAYELEKLAIIIDADWHLFTEENNTDNE